MRFAPGEAHDVVKDSTLMMAMCHLGVTATTGQAGRLTDNHGKMLVCHR